MKKREYKISIDEKSEILDQVIWRKITELIAWELIWVSDRQIRNLLKAYKEYWKKWLEHWLKWRESNHHMKEEKEKVIKDVMKQERLKWCKPIFVAEKLQEVYKIDVSKETVRKIMIENFLRVKRWERKKYEYRIRRPRREYYWEMVQFDGSYHKRIGLKEDEYCLLLAIDDATWKIMDMRIWDNEWYESVVKFWIGYIIKNWVPKSIYLDKFSTYKVNHKKATETKDVRANFDRSMRKIWCKLISANSPQAKWRVERMNQTLQDRLIHELIFEWISDVETANKYIQDVYIPKYNKKFGVIAQKEWNVHRELKKEEISNMKWIFAKEELRSLWYDYIIQYKKHFYQTEISKEYTIYPKKQLLVAETLTWEIRIYAGNNYEEKVVKYKELDYTTVKISRAKYYGEKHRIERERALQAMKQRKEDKFRESKKKQAYRKAKRLIDKFM